MDLVLTGRVITAAEALEIGLVNRVVPKEGFAQAVEELAALLLEKPPFALKACIEAVLHGTEVNFEEGLRLEADLFAMTCGTLDQKEGMSAFLEKRKAEFRGR